MASRKLTHRRMVPCMRSLFLAVVLSAMGTTAGVCGQYEPGSPEDIAERTYVIGPDAARRIGYRIDWQVPSPEQEPILDTVVEDTAVFTLDTRNLLSRYDRRNGHRAWRIAVDHPGTEIISFTYAPSIQKIYVNSGGSFLILDAETGRRLQRSRLEKIANTSIRTWNNFFIYGSRNGQLAWYSPMINAPWKSYQIASTIEVDPVVSDGYVVTVGNNGEIMCLLAGSAHQVWNARALAPIVSPPAIGGGTVFIASLDQHLRAYDLGASRTPIWSYLTTGKLSASPVLIGPRVYQQVPKEGLLCFEARPENAPGGHLHWTADDVTGNVISSHRDTLVLWDEDLRQITLIDGRVGAVIDRVLVNKAMSILSTGTVDGELYVTGNQGQTERLVPR